MRPYIMPIVSSFLLFVAFIAYAQRHPTITLQIPGGGEYIYGITFNRDLTKIYVGSNDLTIWDLNTGEKLKTIVSPLNVGAIAISPDEKLIATSGTPSEMILWDALTETQIRSFYGRQDDPKNPFSIFGLAFSTDGKRVFGGSYKGPLMEWNTESGQSKEIGGAAAYTIALFPDETRIFQTGTDNRGWIASLIDGKRIHSFPGSGASISSDFKYVYNFYAEQEPPYRAYLQTQDVNTGELLSNSGKFDFKGDANSLASPTGNIVIRKDAVLLNLFNVDSKAEVASLSTAVEKPYDKILFTPDGKKVVATIGTTVHIWDVSDLTSHVKQAGKY